MNILTVSLLVILLLLILAGVGSADSSIPNLSAGKMSASFYGSFSLRYGGIPIIRESSLWVHDPSWRVHYYGFNQVGKDITVREIDGGKEGLIPYHNEHFLGHHRVTVKPNSASFEFQYKLISDVKDADMEYCFGFLSAPLIAGCPFQAETENGPVSGTVPAICKSSNSMETLLTPSPIHKITIASRIGKMTLEVTGEPAGVMIFDARKVFAEWAERAPVFWCGVLGTHLETGQDHTQTITLTLDPTSVEQPRPSAQPAGGEVRAEDSAELRVPAERPVLVIPAPKSMKETPGDFVLTPETRIVVAEEARGEDFYGALSFASEVRDLYGIALPVVRESQAPKIGAILVGEAGENKLLAESAAAEKLSAPAKEEGYAIRVTPERVLVLGHDQQGSYYGMQTLKQLVKASAKSVSLQGCEISDWPSLKYRGALVFGGNEALPFHKKLIDRIFARYKYNNMVMADGFIQWDSAPKTWAPFSMPKKDVRADVSYARRHFILLEPLIQSMGHTLWMFNNGQNMDFVENPERPYGYCPLNPKSHEFLFRIYDEALELFPHKYFHIGHDEVLAPFVHEECKRRPVGDLIVQDIKALQDYLKKRGVEHVMIWSDMFLAPGEGTDATNAPDKKEARRRRDMLPKDLIITDWHYAPGKPEEFVSTKIWHDEGFQYIACPWWRADNIAGLAEAAKRNGAMGYLHTLWAGWNNREEILKESYEQVTAYILGAESAWNAGERTPDDLPYKVDEEFRRQWDRTAPDRTPRKGFTVDLSPLYNVPLADNAQHTGWLNLGPESDLASAPTGTQRLGGDLFRLAARNDANSAIRLAGTLTSAVVYPAKVEIPIGRKADSLLFLQTCDWPDNAGKMVGSFRVVYKDGTAQEIKLIYGDNIAAWSDPRTCPNGPEVWSGHTKAGDKISLRRMEWKNPSPDKSIARLEFQTAPAEAAPCLLGVSGISGE